MTDRRVVALDGPVDLVRTLLPLRRGYGDPTIRIADGQASLALRTPEGGAVLHVRQIATSRVEAEASGPGRVRALEATVGLVGALDDPSAFEPSDAPMRRLTRRLRGIRLTTAPVLPVVFAAALEQKVTGPEARGAWRGIVRATSDPAGEGLWLPPDPSRVAELPSFTFHRIGVERRRADRVRTVAGYAARIEREATLGSGSFRAWLERLPGIGPWTSAEVARTALGDPDAVSVGDFHLPHVVSWALAGEARGNDERMLELLEPYRGQRGRVQRLLEASGVKPPAFGPKQEVRGIAGW
jgi:3-methyladenine DNA glycosylase/8-oxoguanine DNA glycosylase